MRKPLSSLVLASIFFQIPSALGGTYQSTCPATQLMKIEADIRKNYKPSIRVDPNKTGPKSVETKIKRAAKKCRVPIELTGEVISSPDVSIPLTRVTSWVKSGYSNRRVNTGVTTTILFGPLGALGFLSKKHSYSFVVKGFDADGKRATVQIDLFKKPEIERLTQELLLLTGLTMGEKRSLAQIKRIESEGFDSSLVEEEKEEEIRIAPLKKADESKLETLKKQNYMP